MFKYRFRKFLVANRFLIEIVNFYYRKKNRKNFNNGINRRSQASLFNIGILTQELPYYPADWVIDNNLYGISHTLKNYAGIKKPIKAYIEHGVFFGNHIQLDEGEWFVPSIITFSDVRKAHIWNGGINKSVEVVGPYIHYAESIYKPEKFKELKEELGKVLLVFPHHSSKTYEAKYSLENCIDTIESLRNGFDTVLISLFWVDVYRKDLVKAFGDKGYKIVTSGHKYDVNFLNRQRTIIELADFTISDTVGTHIGYCIHLGKPHYIYSAEVVKDPKNKAGLTLSTKINKSREEEKAEVYNAFKDFSPTITNAQLEIVRKFWGTGNVKSSSELNKVLTRINKAQ